MGTMVFDDARLANEFLVESEELLASMMQCIQKLRERPSEVATMVLLSRDAHTLRGIARVARWQAIEDLSRRLESTLERHRKSEEPPSEAALQMLGASVRALVELVRAMKSKHRKSAPSAEPTRAVCSAQEGAAGPPKRHPSVLVIDDSRTVLRFVESKLSQAGMRVTTASTMAAAAELVPEIDPALVLLDMSVADMNGESELQRLKESGKAPVVLFSHHPTATLAESTRQLGAAGYLRKTADGRELVARVSEWLDKRRRSAGGG